MSDRKDGKRVRKSWRAADREKPHPGITSVWQRDRYTRAIPITYYNINYSLPNYDQADNMQTTAFQPNV